jgi:hypothetical protein
MLLSIIINNKSQSIRKYKNRAMQVPQLHEKQERQRMQYSSTMFQNIKHMGNIIFQQITTFFKVTHFVVISSSSILLPYKSVRRFNQFKKTITGNVYSEYIII